MPGSLFFLFSIRENKSESVGLLTVATRYLPPLTVIESPLEWAARYVVLVFTAVFILVLARLSYV